MILLYFLLLSVMVFWAGSFIFIKLAISDINPASLTLYRFSLATIFLVPFVKKMLDFKDTFRFIVLGVSGVSLLYILQFSALYYTTPTNASILINTSVLFIAAMSREKLSPKQKAGIILSFLGIVLILFKRDFALSLIGDLMVIGNGILWAIYTVYAKQLFEKYSSFEIVFYSFLFGIITLAPFFSIFPLEIPNKTLTWISVVYLAILCSVVGYVVWYYCVEKIGAARTSVFVYLIPLFTAIMSYFVFSEEFTARKIFGGFLTILGIYLVERGR
ncbi:DMT family transporter [Ferroglobus sp.]|uniref:DMT family transporter n=1 Tax=Ferroglobus sp. TaxID=2614230 RepID=UPI0025B99277|nr:DMT family transporter [Ferroglobus sp.]